jgi:hypothetical protein
MATRGVREGEGKYGGASCRQQEWGIAHSPVRDKPMRSASTSYFKPRDDHRRDARGGWREGGRGERPKAGGWGEVVVGAARKARRQGAKEQRSTNYQQPPKQAQAAGNSIATIAARSLTITTDVH